MSYFIATCKYEKMQENGAVKRVSEKYLCDALSIVEANAVVTENLKPYISGDFFTSKVENSPIAEVMSDKEADKFYLAKVAFVTIDERSGKEKKNRIAVANRRDRLQRCLRNRPAGVQQVNGRLRTCESD